MTKCYLILLYICWSRLNSHSCSCCCWLDVRCCYWLNESCCCCCWLDESCGSCWLNKSNIFCWWSSLNSSYWSGWGYSRWIDYKWSSSNFWTSDVLIWNWGCLVLSWISNCLNSWNRGRCFINFFSYHLFLLTEPITIIIWCSHICWLNISYSLTLRIYLLSGLSISLYALNSTSFCPG